MKKTNIIDFGLMGKQISALFYLLGHEIGVYNKSKLNIYEFEKQIKLLQRKIDFSNFNAGKINIYQHIEDLKNSLTIESLNEDLNLKKEIMQILRDNNNIVFSNSSSLSMDDLNCDFIHFFNTIYINCDSNLERFTPLKDLKKLGFHIICSKGNRGALANLLLFNEISSFFKIIEKYDYNFKECQTVYDLLYEKRNLLNIIDTIGIELCNKICKNLKEDDENFYHPKIFKKAL
ncbi:3-hydroxyacyl-CoA dehydrogenase NAD-binding domain-containing protein [Campylobacter jejuni]